MPSSKFAYPLPSITSNQVVREVQIEYGFIGTLQNLQYEYSADIRDRSALGRNFREKFKAMNGAKLTLQKVSKGGTLDICQPPEMVGDNKKWFRQILDTFSGRCEFMFPEFFARAGKKKAAAATV